MIRRGNNVRHFLAVDKADQYIFFYIFFYSSSSGSAPDFWLSSVAESVHFRPVPGSSSEPGSGSSCQSGIQNIFYNLLQTWKQTWSIGSFEVTQTLLNTAVLTETRQQRFVNIYLFLGFFACFE